MSEDKFPRDIVVMKDGIYKVESIKTDGGKVIGYVYTKETSILKNKKIKLKGQNRRRW